MVPAPHLQRVTSFNLGPPALLPPPSGWGLPGPRVPLPHLGTLEAGESRTRAESIWRTGELGQGAGDAPEGRAPCSLCPAAGPCTFQSRLHTAAGPQHHPKAQTEPALPHSFPLALLPRPILKALHLQFQLMPITLSFLSLYTPKHIT